MLDFKRNTEFVVLTFSFKGVQGCSQLYRVRVREQQDVYIIKELPLLHSSLDVDVNTPKINLEVSTLHSESLFPLESSVLELRDRTKWSEYFQTALYTITCFFFKITKTLSRTYSLPFHFHNPACGRA